VEEAAAFFARLTDNSLVITLGKDGCYCFDINAAQAGCFVRGVPVETVDTTGAGDAHCGAVIAGVRQGRPLAEAAAVANRVGAAVARTHGADLRGMPELAGLKG
jgi:sugar/nucleoside kinase (ribokinase family)